MAQCLRTRTALAENVSQVPSAQVRWLTTACKCNSRRSNIGTSLTCARTHTHTHTHTTFRERVDNEGNLLTRLFYSFVFFNLPLSKGNSINIKMSDPDCIVHS